MPAEDEKQKAEDLWNRVDQRLGVNVEDVLSADPKSPYGFIGKRLTIGDLVNPPFRYYTVLLAEQHNVCFCCGGRIHKFKRVANSPDLIALGAPACRMIADRANPNKYRNVVWACARCLLDWGAKKFDAKQTEQVLALWARVDVRCGLPVKRKNDAGTNKRR